MERSLAGATPQVVRREIHSAGGSRTGAGLLLAVEIEQLLGHVSPDLARVHEG